MDQGNQQRLEQLLQARHVCVRMVTHEEAYALELVREAGMALGRPVLVWSLSGGIQDALVGNQPPVPNTEDPANALIHLSERGDRPICVTLDLAEHCKQGKALRVLRNMLNHFKHNGSQLVMIDHEDALPPVLEATATKFEPALPDDEEVSEIVKSTLRIARQAGPIEIDITRKNWTTVLRNLRGLNRMQIERVILDCVGDDRRFDDEDLNRILANKRRELAGGGLLEYIETPVSLAEIGGLRKLKEWLAHRERALGDDAQQFGLSNPRGVLMLGIQGAGKSLCAKAIAAAWQRPLLRMDVGALYDRYVGESERRLRDALAQAEAMAPNILWIDEVEKAFASAASQSTDGGLSKRMFGTLLTWMQEHQAAVFLVATANDIEALPPELLRKGRFDEIFFVDLPRADVRAKIFAIHLKKRKRDPKQFDLKALSKAAEGFSGAEIEQAVLAGLHEAFANERELDTELIIKQVENSPPLSVTRAEQIAELRRWAKDRCVPAD